MGEATHGPAPVLPVVRAGLWVLFVLAIANGAFLYLFPSHAEPDYAWAIAPPINAAFMGAGYLAGAVTSGLGIFATRHWRSLRPLVPGFCALGILLFAATLIHEDRFRWDYAAHLALDRDLRGAPDRLVHPAAHAGPASRRDSPSATRRSGLAGSPPRPERCSSPSRSSSSSLPTPSSRSGRGRSPRCSRGSSPAGTRSRGSRCSSRPATAARAHEAVNPYLTVAAWSLLVLSVLPIYSDDVSSDAGLFWPFIALQVLVLAVAGWSAARAASAMRAAGEEM